MFKKTGLAGLVFICSFALGNGEAHAQQTLIGNQCSLPGPQADDRCTVLYHVTGNPANNIVCLWAGNSLVDCQGKTRFGGGYDHVTQSGTTLELRRHANWPTSHPAWPNAEYVRTTGTLLRSQLAVTRYRASPSSACDVVVPVGGSIQAALDTPSYMTVCLAPGSHAVTASLLPRSNQTLRSQDAANQALLQPAAGVNAADMRIITVQGVSGVTIKDLQIDASGVQRPGYGILVYTASDVLMDKVSVSRSLIGVGITELSDNVELRDSQIINAGDGLAGGAHPSLWINSSNDVRVMKSTLQNNGVGPEGDGELACYATTNLTVHNTSVLNSGAAGMYLVNCDRAIVSGNIIRYAKEWGLDVVNTNQPSGTDYGLFSWNTIEYSRNAAGVVKDSIQNTFQSNLYRYNRQGGSGSCNGINLRGNTTGYYFINDVATPWPVVCNN